MLAQQFTVVAPDLRGYGDSSKPAGDADHANYSKRVMARDMLRVMGSLGFDSFDVLAHDRGARVAARLAADHPDAVRRLVMLDIAPDPGDVRADHRGLRPRLLALVLPDPAGAAAGTADRGRPGRVRHRPDGRPQLRVWHRSIRARWPNTNAAWHNPERPIPCARTTGPAPPSTWSTTAPIVTRTGS